MALLETIKRRLVKTGTLVKIIKLLPRLSLLFVIGSLLLVFQLATDGQFRGTYISENALMPSQAHPFFRESEWNFVRGYRNEVVNLMGKNQTERNEVFEDWLIQMGYKTSYHTFTNSNGIEKKTLYAIYHVPKGDDTEALVLAAPWWTDDGKLNVGGLALAMGLGRYFHRLSIWAKNIILVFPDNGIEDMRQWANAYHTTLDHTGGSIESAIIMEFPSTSDYLSYVEVEFSGVNGQLPNLDLVNTAIHVGQTEGFKFSVNHAPYGQLWTNDFYSRASSIWSNIFDLAAAGSVRSVNSQAFTGWGIQSIALRGRGDNGTDITVFGRMVEGTFRSVNNLLEKFHQSFFFYLLLGPNMFVSIASYLPAGGLAAAAFMVASINAWTGGAYIGDKKIEIIKNGTIDASSLKFTSQSLVYAFGTYIFILISSVYYGTNFMNKLVTSTPIEIWYKWTYGMFILPFLIINLLPIFSFLMPLNKLIPITTKDRHAMNDFTRGLATISLFYLSYALIALLVLNFALSFIIALLCSSLCFIRYTNKDSLSRAFSVKTRNTIFLFLTSPAIWLIFVSLLKESEFKIDRIRNLIQYFQYSLLQREIQNLIDFWQTVDDEWVLMCPVRVFRDLVLSWERVQCWTWLFICISWVPVWLSMVIVGSIDVESDDSEHKLKAE